MYSSSKHIVSDFFFLKSVLGEVQQAIKAFEGEQVDPLKLLDSLASLIKSASESTEKVDDKQHSLFYLIILLTILLRADTHN